MLQFNVFPLMYLTSQNVAFYLAGRGLIPFHSMVNDTLTVVEAPRRNRNFKVMRGTQPGFFVKQVASFEPLAMETHRRDGRCYWLANNHAEFTALLPLLPAFHTFDVAQSILVTALLDGAETLHQLHLQTGTFPTDVAVLLANALAHFHVAFRGLPASAASVAFPRMHPWALTTGDPALFPSAMQTPTGRVFLDIMRARGVEQALTVERQRWRVETLVHGDLKWDNVLLTPVTASAAGALRIVDWEIADVGDPAWDIAAIFQAYLAHWLFSRTPGNESIPESDVQFSAMQPAMRAFWSAYVIASGTINPAELLDRSVAFAAARLVQTAYESLYQAPSVTAHALSFLDLAERLLTARTNAPRVILGH
ncbi:MAG: aminoglycoside phosphotransferase family protein [Gemmatimonadota bacterium]|nr:aminoglycoside phosphotransferase family protein [Gemmatimonadota bacterium]